MSTEQEPQDNTYMFVGGPVNGEMLHASQFRMMVPVFVPHYYESRHITMADGSRVKVYAPPTMSGEDVAAEYERITKEQSEST